eukprot:3302824-Lingulodinium_polyedra.AAC.1
MMRSSRPSAVAAVRTLRAFHANRRLHGVRARNWRAVVAADGRFDRIIGCINCICIDCCV